MELFPAADDDAWTLIKSVIDDSDYYLLVVGGRYGSVDPVDKVGFTEKEYKYAVSKNKPVMAFIHGSPETIPVGKTDPDDEGRKSLQQFRAKIQSAKHVKYWTSPDDLAGKVARSYVSFVRNYPAIGWIRADQQSSPEALAEINLLRNSLVELESQIAATSVAPPPGTDNLAQGADVVEFEVSATASARKESGDGYKLDNYVDIKTTWDEIFSAVGHRLMQDCEERILRKAVDEWLVNVSWHESDVDEQLFSILRNNKVKTTGYTISARAAHLDTEDFGLIKIQLKALGLIQHSPRKRSVNDRGTYWTLTPYGENRMIQLLAVKKEDLVEDVEEIDGGGKEDGDRD